MQKKRAFISVSDKTGVADFAKGLEDLGYEIISTGGTLEKLNKSGVSAISVTKITGFPECLDGRVKTMHPAIHAGILAMRNNEEHMRQIEELGIAPIDVVAINLYPFRATISKPDVKFAEAIENIDIGGPTAIRAAAKNWQDVYVVCDPADYEKVLDELKNATSADDSLKRRLSAKVFAHTAGYDALISNYLQEQLENGGICEKYPETITITFDKSQDMRYGENPHQSAAFYREPITVEGTLAAAYQHQGKELSFNNINDADAAISLAREFAGDSGIACVVVKHANPCGVAFGGNVFDAYSKAFEADPVSIFGGIVVVNGEVDEQTAKKMSEIFLEVIIAPSYSKPALKIFAGKPNLRILELDVRRGESAAKTDYKRVAGGLLVQDANNLLLRDTKVVTKRKPTELEMEQLLFAWKVVKYTKSNGIVLAKNNATVGIGPGQTNRITALELAIKYAGDKVAGSVMASDAFFPFDDCVKTAAQAGITAIIQPGGANRDDDSIQACNAADIAMIFTEGVRHFRH
ncbi:MAG: bifunctional phosphoribosylaminoimidazolecarboxamide formyltransferase/IMP cyclohydrolase [Clostridiales bacterium]|jgi:phosphoribosylaminoimidazolecarboxamide formyltransferase/IMP cyclohydrolase|nr:bifunctional phosphoribosylaminoimidazolecarboxamide formyltransferase/IMP cyclohydrolase [Clostridiales bacterium]